MVVGIVGSSADASAVVLKTQVFTVPDTDAVALSAAVVILGVVAACACDVPAWRATRISPLLILRSE